MKRLSAISLSILSLILSMLLIVPFSYAHNLPLDSLREQVALWEDSSASMEKAKIWRSYAYTADKVGLHEDAQTYAQGAYEMFMEMGETGWASLCLYERCIAYNAIGDAENMSDLVAELEVLARQDTSALTQYNYYSILFAYYTSTEADVSLTEKIGRKSIYYMERIGDYKQYNIVPAWNYYNQALFYDVSFNPPMIDSIRRYIDLAAQSTLEMSWLDSLEVLISVGDERAWLYYYENDYVRAESQMLDVIVLLDTVSAHSPSSIINERSEAYAFLVDLYTIEKRYEEALHFLQKQKENDLLRYNIERQRVLDDIQTRYEVAQGELSLQREQHRTHVLISLLITFALLILVILSILCAVYFKKREMEEKLYTMALESDNMYNSLQDLKRSNTIEPMEVLRQGLLMQVQSLPDKSPYKSDVLLRLQDVDLLSFHQQIGYIEGLSVMDKRYLLCFAAGLSAEQVSVLFSISPASVYTVRYRIRKKYMASLWSKGQKEDVFPW